MRSIFLSICALFLLSGNPSFGQPMRLPALVKPNRNQYAMERAENENLSPEIRISLHSKYGLDQIQQQPTGTSNQTGKRSGNHACEHTSSL